ncbi:MAG: nucleotidyltransferase domain-containing protein [Candidatus Shapirobacteria bacterium]|nr:nucleotidyltransferase domain-containing protein [Candidatus Shapirobacteria bacterium]
MSVSLAIKRTIKYAKNFKSHINKEEIKKRLISKKVYPEEVLKQEIYKLNWKNKKNKWRNSKINKARKLADLIKNNFKDIVFLGISGSVSSGHPKKNDDIDLLVITKTNTLWKNRLALRWWMYKNRIPHRVFDKVESKDQFCFNLWLDESYLEIPKNRQNLGSAVDLLLLIPLINRNQTYEIFLKTNKWAKKFVATPYKNKIFNFQFSIFKKNQKENKIDKIINYLYFWPQYWYMKSKITKEQISPYQAFFHR